MANRFLNNITINDSYTLPSSDGSADQIIQTDGAGNLTFIDPSALAVGESEQVHIACKNTSGVAISKGDPVYITGTVGTSYIIQIAKADASDSAKMPAVGLAETDLAINAEGFVIVSGVLKNITTDPLSTGDGTPSSNNTVYVKAGGGLTRTKPTGSGNLIQNVGKVGRVNSANAGSLAVSTIMRTNDVPNLTTGKIWVGSPTYTTESTVVHLDETNGRMGIETTSPTTRLDLGASNTIGTGLGFGSTSSELRRGNSGNNVQLSHWANLSMIIDSDNNDTTRYFNVMHGANDSSTATELFRVQENGDVGIGVVPSSVTHGPHLEVGNLRGTISSGTGYFEDNGSTNFLNGARPLAFGTSGSEKMRIDSSGNVGIGETSVDARLHITTGSSGLVNQKFESAGSAAWRVGIPASQTYFAFDNANDNLSAPKVVINSSGNVGIGTTGPTQKLHVEGNARVTGAYYDSNNSAGTSGQVLSSTATGTDWIDAPSTTDGLAKEYYWTSQNTSNSGTIWRKIGTYNPVGQSSRIMIKAVGTSGYGGGLELAGKTTIVAQVNNNNLLEGSFWEENMSAQYGSVGFVSNSQTSHDIYYQMGSYSEFAFEAIISDGTFTPAATTVSTPTFTKTATRQWNVNTDLVVNSSGNVGIGTAGPAYKLDILSSSSVGFRLKTDGFTGLDLVSDRTSGNLGGVRFLQTGDTYQTAEFVGIHGGAFDWKIGDGVTTAPTSKMYLNNTGLGIGTTSPSQKLHVAGNARVTGAYYDSNNSAGTSGQVLSSTATGTDWVSLSEISGVDGTGTTNYVAKWSDADTITNSVIYDNGTNVGIGTTSPIHKLDVNGIIVSNSSNPQLRMLSTANQTNYLVFGDAQDDDVGYISYEHSSNTLGFRVNASERMRIDSSGNVGIGTTSPRYQLDLAKVNDSSQADYIALGVYNGPSSGTGTALGSGIIWKPNFSGYTKRSAGIVQIAENNYFQSGLAFFTNGTADATTDWSERMRIDKDGDVGIGTTSPSSKLHVEGGAVRATGGTSNGKNIQLYVNDSWGYLTTSASKFYLDKEIRVDSGLIGSYDESLQLRTSGTTRMYIDNSNGNVGIGTTSPDVSLEVVTASPTDGIIADFVNSTNAGGTIAAIKLSNSDSESCDVVLGANRVGANFGSDFFISLSDGVDGSNQERFRITESGNVGIGTTSPAAAAKLTVMGNQTFGLPGNGTNTSGRFISIEGNTDGSGEGSSRVFFTEHNSSTAGMDSYGMSLGYRGGSATIVGASGNTWTGLTQIGNGEWGMFGHDNNATGVKIMQGSRSATYTAFYSSGSETMRVTGGNVGIGTTSPDSKLETKDGDIRVTTYNSFSKFKSGRASIPSSVGFNLGGILFEAYSTGTTYTTGAAIESYSDEEWTSTSTPSYLSFQTVTSGSTSLSEKMAIKGDGYVGIGTNVPNAILHVNTSSINKFIGTNADYVYNSTGSGVLITTGASTGNTYSQIYAFQSGQTAYANLVVPGGNVGIGTNNPGAKLELSGASGQLLILDDSSATGNPYMSFYQAGTRRSYIQHVDASNLLTFVSEYGGIMFMTGTGGTEVEKMRILADGNVGINTTAPTEKLAVTGNIETTESANGVKIGFNVGDSFTLNGADTAHYGLSCGTSASVPLVLSGYYGVAIATNGLERVRILQSNGYVGILNTSPSYALDVTGTIRATGNVIAFSDARAKENIKTIDSALEKVNKLRGVEFNKIGEEKTCIGVIAQEVEEVLPEVVETDDNGMKAVAYGNMVGLLIEAMKEQQKQIDELKAKLESYGS